MCSRRLQLSAGLTQRKSELGSAEMTKCCQLGKWAQLLMSLIACGVTGNVEPLFVCLPEHLTPGCVWLKRLICKALLKTQALLRLYDLEGACV